MEALRLRPQCGAVTFSWQVLVVPVRVNVSLKAVTVEDLVARRKVRYHQGKGMESIYVS